MSNKFWNIQPVEKPVRTPIAILHDVAAELKGDTHGALVGKITSQVPHGNFYLSFTMRAAAQRYNLELFRCLHGPEQYPVYLYDRELLGKNSTYLETFVESAIQANSPEELEAAIQQVLSQPDISRIINGLLMATADIRELNAAIVDSD